MSAPNNPPPSFLLHMNSIKHILASVLSMLDIQDAGLGIFDRMGHEECLHTQWRGSSCDCPPKSDVVARSTWINGLLPLACEQASLSACYKHIGEHPVDPNDPKVQLAFSTFASVLDMALQHSNSLAEFNSFLQDLGKVFVENQGMNAPIQVLVDLVSQLPVVRGAGAFTVSEANGTHILERTTKGNLAGRSPIADLWFLQKRRLDNAFWEKLETDRAVITPLDAVFTDLQTHPHQLPEEWLQVGFLVLLLRDVPACHVLISRLEARPLQGIDRASLPLLACVAERYESAAMNRRSLKLAFPRSFLGHPGFKLHGEWSNSLKSSIERFVMKCMQTSVDFRQLVLELYQELTENYGLDQLELVKKLLHPFHELEDQLYHMPHYRDHFIHPLLVFLSGLVVMGTMEQAGTKLDDLFSAAYGESEFADRSAIEKAWFTTAAFHDISYPICRLPDWIEHVFPDLSRLESKDRKFVDIDVASLERQFGTEIGMLSAILSRHIAGTNSRSSHFSRLLRMHLRACDHGVVSALLLLIGMDGVNSGTVPFLAASAIATHSNLLFLPADADILESGPEEAIRDLSRKRRERSEYRSQIPFRDHPLACMLAFTDTIQEWGRKFDHGALSAVTFPSFKNLTSLNGVVTAEISIPAEMPGTLHRVLNEKAAVLETISTLEHPFDIVVDFAKHGIRRSAR